MAWLDEHDAWQRRDLSAKRYDIWPMASISKRAPRRLKAVHPGADRRDVGRPARNWSAQDWRDLLLDLKRRGLDVAPRLVIADGALGFWKAAARSGRKSASSAAGCTRPPTCSPSCRRASSRRPNARCRRSGWLKR